MTYGAHITPDSTENLVQHGIRGEIPTVKFTTGSGYLFPETSNLYKTENGITVERTGDREITVSGTLTGSVDITIPDVEVLPATAPVITEQPTGFEVVYLQPSGTTAVTATAERQATISGGSLTIHDCEITVTQNSSFAAISSGDVTIYAGSLSATARQGAGIGGSVNSGYNGTVRIYGGSSEEAYLIYGMEGGKYLMSLTFVFGDNFGEREFMDVDDMRYCLDRGELYYVTGLTQVPDSGNDDGEWDVYSSEDGTITAIWFDYNNGPDLSKSNTLTQIDSTDSMPITLHIESSKYEEFDFTLNLVPTSKQPQQFDVMLIPEKLSENVRKKFTDGGQLRS